MDAWTQWIEFFACGLMVLPTTLGIGTGSFVVFATTLGLMQVLFIAIVCGAPTVPARAERRRRPRPQSRQE